VTNEASTPSTARVDQQSDAQRTARPASPRLEVAEAAAELMAIVGYVTADDGPLQPAPEDAGLSPWHGPLLAKASERLDVIDVYLRGRVAFLVAGKEHGYPALEGELRLAQAALDTCRAVTMAVEALLEGRLPRVWQFDLMGDTTLRLFNALAAE
jgi:hypothetical protein